ncbi:hypothetical protein IMZ48_10630 [Candidatus Bathyarchaeota archaeon]|nr:hypothetical protein [Candidatus Bathyarchaeota archaeon]
MKWWATTAIESDYDWDDMTLPHLHIKNADVFEEPMDSWMGDRMQMGSRIHNMGHAVVVLPIKLRVLCDLENIQSATRAFAGVLPPEDHRHHPGPPHWQHSGSAARYP